MRPYCREGIASAEYRLMTGPESTRVHRRRRQGTGGACHAPLLREGIASAEYRLAMTRPESTRGGYGGRTRSVGGGVPTRSVGTRENRLCVELYWVQPGDQVALYTLRQQLELAVDGFEPHLLGVHGGPAQLFLRFFA